MSGSRLSLWGWHSSAGDEGCFSCWLGAAWVQTQKAEWNVILIGQSTWSSCRDNIYAASSLLSQCWTLTSIACPESGRAPFHSSPGARGLNPTSPSSGCGIFCKSHMREQSMWGLAVWSGQIPGPCCRDLSRAWYQPGHSRQFHRHSLTTFNDLSDLLQPFGFCRVSFPQIGAWAPCKEIMNSGCIEQSLHCLPTPLLIFCYFSF